MKTLYQHAFQSPALRQVGRLSNSTILLLSTISCWPFAWRKLALSATRTQKDFKTNIRLQNDLEQLYQGLDPTYIISPVSGEIVHLQDIIGHLSIAILSPVLASVLSMFLRAELLDSKDVEEQTSRVILKELNAAIFPDRVQQLQYFGLSDPSDHPTLFDTPAPYESGVLLKAWQNGVFRLRDMLV